KLPHLNSVIEKRRANAKKYISLLEGVVTLPRENPGYHHTYHTFVIQCDRRDDLQKFLQEREIETKIHYPIPIHQQEAAKELNYKPGSLPKTEAQAKRILSLPVHQHLKPEQLEWVAASIRTF